MKKIILSLLIVSGLSADVCIVYMESYVKNRQKFNIHIKLVDNHSSICMYSRIILDRLIDVKTECEKYKDDENINKELETFTRLSETCSKAGY